jgi:hypothetical protein
MNVTKLANRIPGIKLPPSRADLPDLHIPRAHSKRRKKAMSDFYDMIERCVPSDLESIMSTPSPHGRNGHRRNGTAPKKGRKAKERSKSR